MQGKHWALAPTDIDVDDDVLINDTADDEDSVPHNTYMHASAHVRGGSTKSRKWFFFAATLVRLPIRIQSYVRGCCYPWAAAQIGHSFVSQSSVACVHEALCLSTPTLKLTVIYGVHVLRHEPKTF